MRKLITSLTKLLIQEVAVAYASEANEITAATNSAPNVIMYVGKLIRKL